MNTFVTHIMKGSEPDYLVMVRRAGLEPGHFKFTAISRANYHRYAPINVLSYLSPCGQTLGIGGDQHARILPHPSTWGRLQR